jgi:hypothetical protein
MRQSLDLLHRLKNNRILYVPSIFTPLEDTRMASGNALKAKQLTKLQWEFIMTAWKQSREFGEMRDRSRAFFSIGTKIFYQARGRWVHGTQFKWPAMRFADVSEEKLQHHLYLNWDKENTLPLRKPRLIAKHRKDSLEQLARIHETEPFSIYGTSRAADAPGEGNAFQAHAGNGKTNGHANGGTQVIEEESVAGD